MRASWQRDSIPWPNRSDRPPYLSALRDSTVYDKVRALKARGCGPKGWTPHWFRHTHATALLLAGSPEWVVSRRLGHAHVQTTVDLYAWSARMRLSVPQPIGSSSPENGRLPVREFAPVIRGVVNLGCDPVGRLLADLPDAWRGEIIGAGIDDWACRVKARQPSARVRLSGVSYRLRVEISWIMHWQYQDGVKIAHFTYGQMGAALAWHASRGRPLPESLAHVDLPTMVRLRSTWFEATRGRLPARHAHERIRRALGYPRLALGILRRVGEQPGGSPVGAPRRSDTGTSTQRKPESEASTANALRVIRRSLGVSSRLDQPSSVYLSVAFRHLSGPPRTSTNVVTTQSARVGGNGDLPRFEPWGSQPWSSSSAAMSHGVGPGISTLSPGRYSASLWYRPSWGRLSTSTLPCLRSAIT
jgi:hypothetical protein